MPRHFIHPRSREAEYTQARVARNVRVRDEGLYRRVLKRYPILSILKYVQAHCLQSKDKRHYTEAQMQDLAEQYIRLAFAQVQEMKRNTLYEERALALKKAIYYYQNGDFEVPDLGDECNVVTVLAWDGYSSTAQAIAMRKIGRRSFELVL